MTFAIDKLSPDLTFGCIVNGLPRDELKSAETRETLRERWVMDGLIIFRGSKVTPEFQVDLSECFANTREVRIVERTTLDGDYGLGRKLTTAPG